MIQILPKFAPINIKYSKKKAKMRILTPRNNKDFYDYLTGIYGIDERVIFDRRSFTSLKNLDSPLFSNIIRPEDRKKEFKKYDTYDHVNDTWFKRPIGEFFKCLLEAGNHWYIFRVERYLDDYGKVHLDWEFIKRFVIEKQLHGGNTPVTFYENVDYISWDKPEYIKKKYLKNGVPNPIVKDTILTSFIEAEDMYQGIYSYISSLNEKDYADTRDDIQKLESAGFDKKISFRNIK